MGGIVHMEEHRPSSVLNIVELITGKTNQLRYVERFSNCRTHIKETIAEHCFFVAYYSLMITHYVNRKTPGTNTVSMGSVLGKALLHDVEEQFTGDIVRPVKYADDSIRHGINRMCEAMVKDYFVELTDVVSAEDMYTGWHTAKNDTLEGYIVTFADFLSVLSYLHEEILSGNHIIMRSVSLTNYINKFKSKEYDFIREMVNATHPIVYNLEQVKRRL